MCVDDEAVIRKVALRKYEEFRAACADILDPSRLLV